MAREPSRPGGWDHWSGRPSRPAAWSSLSTGGLYRRCCLGLGDGLGHLALDIPQGKKARQISVNFGGPVENGRGFVLHSADYDGNASTLKVSDAIGMTATLDILEDISRGDGPSAAFLALGYAGWGPGQLEGELQHNGWLTCDAPPDLVFDTDAESKWERALGILGIDPLLLSATGGRA